MNRPSSLWWQFDFVLLAIAALLIGFGILVIRSATLDAIDTDLITRVPDQIRYALIGALLIFGLAAMDYRILSGLSTWFYVAMVFLLVLVPFIGREGAGGAQRWLSFGILIQPSEISKILLILTLAHFFSQRLKEMNRLRTVLISLLHVGVPAALIFIQPDLGTTIVVGVIWFTLAWGAGVARPTYRALRPRRDRDATNCLFRRWPTIKWIVSAFSSSRKATLARNTTSTKR